MPMKSNALIPSVALFALAGLALSACGGEQEAESPFPDDMDEAEVTETGENDDAYVFECGDMTVAARFESPERLALSAGGNDFVMMRVVSASGAKFQAGDDASTTFWTQGDSAMLTLEGTDYPECMLVSEPAG